MGMMNQRTIEQWACHSRYTSVMKSLTSKSQQQLMTEFSKAIMLPPIYNCTAMKLGDAFRVMASPMCDQIFLYGMNI